MSKFLDMVTTGTLWFARGDLLGDRHEGSITRPNHEALVAARAKFLDDIRGSVDPALLAALKEHRQSDIELWRTWTAVCSWHSNAFEASWMWNSYVPAAEGVAIHTSVSRLTEALVTAPQPVWIGSVTYLDYETATSASTNALEPLLRKRIEFEGENEVRAMTFLGPLNPPPGVRVPVLLDSLIEEVRPVHG